MPSEERIAYIEQYIAKSKMKNTINEDNENNNHNMDIRYKTVMCNKINNVTIYKVFPNILTSNR